MNNKKINLAAGRLGQGASVTAGATVSKEHPVEYGVGRLGITSADNEASAGTPESAPMKLPFRVLPSDPGNRERNSPFNGLVYPPPAEPIPVVDPPAWEGSSPAYQPPPANGTIGEKISRLALKTLNAFSGLVEECRCRLLMLDGRSRLLLAGGLVSLATCLVILVLWAGGGAAPQTASGGAVALTSSQALPDARLERARQSVKDNAALASVKETAKAETGGPRAWEILSPVDKSDSPIQEPAKTDALAHSEAIVLSKTLPPARQQAPVDDSPRYRDCPPGFALSGVVQTPQGLMANINNIFLPVGGTVNKATVVAIRDYSVEMELEGQRFVLGIGSTPSPAIAPAQTTAPMTDSENDQGNEEAAPAGKPSQAGDPNAESKPPVPQKTSTNQKKSSSPSKSASRS